MTTPTRVTPGHTGSTVVSELAGSSLGGVLVGGVLALVAAVVTGLPGVRSVGLGTGAALLVFGLGSLVVSTVAELAPALALMVALLTYTMQVCLLGLAYWKLNHSDLLDHELDRTWLGVTLMVLTLVWTVVQVMLHRRGVLRQEPLPSHPSAGESDDLARGER